MKLSPQQTEPEPLAGIAEQACELLLANKYAELAEKFGYAVSLGRKPPEAIQEDLSASLSQLGETKLDRTKHPEVQVKYFKANSTNLYAVAEASLTTASGQNVLVELVVFGSGNEFHASLEQISAAA
jgi:hypothetical protein